MAEQLEDRVQQLETNQNECIEDGDNIYGQLREEMRNQEDTQNELHQDSNELANMSNIMLRSKLNSNKGDFERLRRTGQQEAQIGLIGQDLERFIIKNDNIINDVIAVKKISHN